MKKGPLAESKVVAFLRPRFPHAERRVMGGARDRGDVAGIPGVVIEIKDQQRQTLAEWLDEAQEEGGHAGAPIALVWHKRRGTTDPGKWYVTMSGYTALELLEAYVNA